ncbi:MAG: ATP-binding protein [Deltaproteobacteria bacterium]|nr:ATP-binding protein [Deltaproteobacteria bacterium]
MILAVASGKGGTGKTMVTAALASVWDGPLVAVDLDVEEPNLHLFLHPQVKEEESARMDVPVVDEEKCTYCRACSDLCQFKAISVLRDVVLTFPEMCHGCGGCIRICPEGALKTGHRELGTVLSGEANGIGFLMGRLKVGEAMSPPLMRVVKSKLDAMLQNNPKDVLIDAPPGVSCPAVTAVMDCDAVLLVTEPTPFGLYDLKLAVEAFEKLDKPMGVVINRAGIGDEGVYTFCQDRNLPILSEIPYDRQIAKAYSTGNIATEISPAHKAVFTDLLTRVKRIGVEKKEPCHA